MFSGIIEDLGTLVAVKPSDQGAIVTIRTALPVDQIAIGESIAVNGVCLTVIERGAERFTMEVSAETLRRSILGALVPGDRVNLERSLTLNKLLGGHLVMGHVDGVGHIVSILPEGDSSIFTFEAPAEQTRYMIEKGSVAVDGISLTIFGVERRRFSCALIPHTLKMTTLGLKGPGAAVNLEADLIGKYIEKFVAERSIGSVAGK